MHFQKLFGTHQTLSDFICASSTWLLLNPTSNRQHMFDVDYSPVFSYANFDLGLFPPFAMLVLQVPSRNEQLVAFCEVFPITLLCFGELCFLISPFQTAIGSVLFSI